ncbi:MAG: effector binding domain-containing protein [Clostridiaceae bacterium]|nr:effector binding domain-containing protein [Clostridiaceae bacterium]
MDLQTISQVSKALGISTRTLRYYEQIGLLDSIKKDDYAYRTYDEAAITRLQQIIILRKLRIPLKQIDLILKNGDAVLALQVFQNYVRELDDELASLSQIKTIIQTLIHVLNKNIPTPVKLEFLNSESMLKMVDTLIVTKINFKEDKSMENIQTAKSRPAKLNDVRIVYLPPATVAASHFIGENPEENAGRLLDQFVRESGLCKIKPDIRHYGFNHPNPSPDRSEYGYERWVTIPDDMTVPELLVKKQFRGGLYAAHMIPIGSFEEWEWLYDWVKQSDQYLADLGDPECMDGCLEEHLNYFHYVNLAKNEPYDLQLDLLMPIKQKKEQP